MKVVLAHYQLLSHQFVQGKIYYIGNYPSMPLKIVRKENVSFPECKDWMEFEFFGKMNLISWTFFKAEEKMTYFA